MKNSESIAAVPCAILPLSANPVLNENICHGNMDLQRANDFSERMEYFLS